MKYLLLAAILPPLAGCASLRSAVNPPPAASWREAVTAADRTRLREWRSAWTRGLAAARTAGHGGAIAAEGALLHPDAALPGAAIANGRYRCRMIKLGARTAGMRDYVAYPAFTCRVKQERDLQGFAKLTGSQRPVGLIFPHDQLRSVFLGTLVLGDEMGARQYGADPERDLAGYVERIGPNRWRLVLPSPRFESLVDVVELVPA